MALDPEFSGFVEKEAVFTGREFDIAAMPEGAHQIEHVDLSAASLRACNEIENLHYLAVSPGAAYI
jgi:hypothetical protein